MTSSASGCATAWQRREHHRPKTYPERRVRAMGVWSQGATPESLVELGGKCQIRAAIETKVKRYADLLSPELSRVTGGDHFPGGPIHLVDGRLDDGAAP
jgi:hypothetical protein